MESIYKLCFYGGLALAIIFLIVSIVLFIVLKIPKVIGDLTGRNAKKSINAMKNKKSSSSEASKKEQAKYYNQGSGMIKVKEAVSPATRKANRDDTTDLLDSEKNAKRKYDEEETDVLGSESFKAGGRAEEETEVLGSGSVADDEATDVLRADEDDEATDVLRADEDDEATDVLRADEDDEATDVLRADDDDDEATDVLRADEDDEEATDVLRAGDDDGATDVLRADEDDEDATDVLRAETIKPKKKHNATVIYDIVITHTEEGI